METRRVGVFMAFGTLGDVLPIAYVAEAFARERSKYSIRFITHASHQVIGNFLSDAGIEFHSVATPPVLPACTTQQWLTSDAHMVDCLNAVEKALGESYGSRSFIAINFFALEGWHLCELYNVQCLVLAPYVMPYSAPSSFERTFKQLQPSLYRRLQSASPGEVSWSDVLHWMWPLFMERWSSWRVEKLHMSACTLTDPVTQLPVHNWPRAVPLLYGFSDQVVEIPGYWPPSIRVCGFWLPSSSFNSTGIFPPKLSSFLSANGSCKPVFIGLSSIGSMGLLTNPQAMLKVLRQALRISNNKGILFTGGCQLLEAAIMQDADVISTELQHDGVTLHDRLFCYTGFIPYHKLFPECSLVVHHGGSGTTAACLQAGVPQVICPFILDQFYWAERMAWLGVSPEPLKSKQLIPEPGHQTEDIKDAAEAVASALIRASSEQVKARAREISESILPEEGCFNAVEILKRTLF